jgi:type II secretory pathway component GspD/PulD (secretin)
MVKTDTRTHILSTPVIVTTDNTEGKISSSQEKYFLKGNTVDQWGNSRPETEIKPIGLEMTVTPHINKSRNVMMEITQEVSDAGTDQPIEGLGSWPTTMKRSFVASIAVKDRETIVLGGLVRNYKKKEKSMVPLLGEIPLLGRLFRYDTENDTRSEVVVFITPYVMDTPGEIADESGRRKDSLNISDIWQKGWSASKLATDPGGEQPEDVPEDVLEVPEFQRLEIEGWVQEEQDDGAAEDSIPSAEDEVSAETAEEE